MTTRINVVDSTEAKNYIHELFGSFKPEDCAVVKLEDMALIAQLHDKNEDSSTLNASVTLANIKEFRKNAEIILNSLVLSFLRVSAIKVSETVYSESRQIEYLSLRIKYQKVLLHRLCNIFFSDMS